MHINICRGACILGHMHVIIFAASITAKCAKMDFNYTNNGSCVMFGLEMKKGNELIPNLHVREWFDLIWSHILCQRGKHPKFRNNQNPLNGKIETILLFLHTAHSLLQQFARSTLADSTHRHELLMYPDSISYPAHKRSTTLSCKCSPRWEATKFRSYKSKNFHNFG